MIPDEIIRTGIPTEKMFNSIKTISPMKKNVPDKVRITVVVLPFSKLTPITPNRVMIVIKNEIDTIQYNLSVSCVLKA